jgi:CheY-like chemotaxis protein
MHRVPGPHDNVCVTRQFARRYGASPRQSVGKSLIARREIYGILPPAPFSLTPERAICRNSEMSEALPPPRFLVVDDNGDSRFLLVKTLLRKFPGAWIIEAQTAEAAMNVAESGNLTAIITHRTMDMAGVELVRAFRQQNSRVPILMVSSVDRTDDALAAGANRFMSYEEWLRTGSIVDEMIGHYTSA